MSLPIRFRSRRLSRQRGATLFVALMILILLTLLALSAAQVTGLQERMAGLYRADNQAFQTAEDRLRIVERGILSGNPVLCEQPPMTSLPAAWTAATPPTGTDSVVDHWTTIENLNKDSGAFAGIRLGSNAEHGQSLTPGSPGCYIFRMSSIGQDTARTSRVIVQSIFTP